MKSHFNAGWVSSVQPRKQVKFRANAPVHIKRKFLSSLLDKTLRTKMKMRSVTLRKGDEVKVMRGYFKGKLGKVGTIDTKAGRVQIDGLQRSKHGGEKIITWFNPSNVKIIQLVDSDAKRFKNDVKTVSKETKSSSEKK